MKKLSRRSFIHNMSMGSSAMFVSLPVITDACGASNNNQKDKKLNIALCGLGRYAGILADGFADSKHCRLAGIVTGTPAKAEQWKKQYNIPQQNIYNYQNFDEIINNKNIDVVYIVLPNAMHKEFTIRTAKAGKHVFVEKPMATTVKDCQEMIDACKAAGVQMAIGYRLHYEPYHLELKRLGQEKIFGQLRLIEVSLGYKTSDAKEWRLNKVLAGGGPLMNIGIYCVQAGRYTLGEEPVSVTAQFGPITNKALFSEVEESITWQLNFPSGAVCTSTTSYNCDVDRFFASADGGFFELSPAVSYGPFQGRTSKGPLNFPTINQQTAQLDGMGKLLLENKPLPNHITGEEGIKDLRIMEAIYEAANTGKKIVLS